jgi:predicted RNase H-like HicB family nuclease
MELAIRIQIVKLPEGLYLATSDELPGLVAQGRTVAEPSISHVTLPES